MRPVLTRRHGEADIDETTDTWDAVEWLVRNVPHNNGRVGVRGASYPGFYASMAAINAHPAVVVVSPQAPVTEWMGGDDSPEAIPWGMPTAQFYTDSIGVPLFHYYLEGLTGAELCEYEAAVFETGETHGGS